MVVTTPVSIVAAANIRTLLWSMGIDDDVSYVTFSDYAIPTEKWMVEEFFPALQRDQILHNVAFYVDGPNVCTHFARHAADFAARCHLQTRDKPDRTAFGVGEFLYVRPTPPNHAINCWVTRVGEGPLQFRLFEPQPPSHLVEYTQKEIIKCLFARI